MRRSSDFRRLLTTGRRVRRGGISIVSAPGADEQARVGLAVRKGSGTAVQRNRIKRRLRHALREVTWKTGMDYVIVADERVDKVPYQRLVEWLREAAGEEG